MFQGNSLRVWGKEARATQLCGLPSAAQKLSCRTVERAGFGRVECRQEIPRLPFSSSPILDGRGRCCPSRDSHRQPSGPLQDGAASSRAGPASAASRLEGQHHGQHTRARPANRETRRPLHWCSTRWQLVPRLLLQSRRYLMPKLLAREGAMTL